MGLFNRIRAYLAEEDSEEIEEANPKDKQDDFSLMDEIEEDITADISNDISDFGEAPEDMEIFPENTNEEEPRKKRFSLKGLFGRTKDKKEADNPDLELSKEVADFGNTISVRASELKAVQDFCEQLVDATTHMREISAEYSLVTRYLTDIQRIEELPVEMAKEIIEIATKIETLDKNRENYIQSKNLLPPEQYNTIAAHESEILDAIKNLYDMEMRDGVLKNDMGYLEGEKEDLKFMRDEFSDSIARLRGIIITILTIFLITNCMLIVYSVTTKNSVVLFSLFTGLIAVVAFTISYLQYRSIRHEFRENEAKIKRAVSLQNKVKAKYINNTNTVDYIYEKYGVSSAKELEYRYIQYNTMVSDREKYNKTNNNLKRLCDDLTLRLDRIGVEDPDVWTKQISALVDRREMVEIKHSLNQRRQKLRESMVSCDKIKSNANMALKLAMVENPGMEEIIKKQLAPYGIDVE